MLFCFKNACLFAAIIFTFSLYHGVLYLVSVGALTLIFCKGSSAVFKILVLHFPDISISLSVPSCSCGR